MIAISKARSILSRLPTAGTSARSFSIHTHEEEEELPTVDRSPGKPVSSWNEWDPLQEVILGRVEGARVPGLQPCIKSKVTPENWRWLEANGGRPVEREILEKAGMQVEEFCRVLQMEGVTVKRPEVINWDEMGTFKLPFFSEGGGLNTCPRDGLMVVGDEFIESAMAWRSRYFEMFAYKKLLTEYFRQGARWTAAPKPTIRDEMFYKDFPFDDEKKRSQMSDSGQYVLTDEEIAFDAADSVRFGRDVFVTLGNSTNRSGVEWLRRHLDPRGIRVHSVVYKGIYNTHVDTTIVPLRPGLVLMNPSRPLLTINDEPCGWEYFTQRGWQVAFAPEAAVCNDVMFVSKWINMNLLSLDEERVILQKGEEPLKRLLISLGMKPIEVDMIDAFGLGGAFHCWTVDVKRTGKLESYL